jgi:hypothetical protein
LAGFIAIGVFSAKTPSNQTEDKVKKENWSIGSFVDDFGEKTGVKFIHNAIKINGKFSNSATNNSNLKVDFIISKKDVGIELYEYNSSLAHFLDFYNIQIQVQDKNGVRTEFKGTISNAGKRIGIAGQEQNRKIIIGILKAVGIVKFRISVSSSGNVMSNYAFDINADGFDTQYNQL